MPYSNADYLLSFSNILFIVAIIATLFSSAFALFSIRNYYIEKTDIYDGNSIKVYYKTYYSQSILINKDKKVQHVMIKVSDNTGKAGYWYFFDVLPKDQSAFDIFDVSYIEKSDSLSLMIKFSDTDIRQFTIPYNTFEMRDIE